MRTHTSQSPRPNAFSLIELTIILAIGASMISVLLPAISTMRSQMRGIISEANLTTIAQASAAYAQDNDNRIHSFTWRAGETYINLASGNEFIPGSDQEAASRQTQNILQRATGRLNGKGKILSPFSRLPYRRYTHLVLADYLGGIVSSPIWADPADADLLHWQRNQPSSNDEYKKTGIPYAFGAPDQPGYDDDGSWAVNGIRQLWPYATSYQTVPHAWMTDFGPQYSPIDATPHLFQGAIGMELGERRHHQVRFPQLKVHMFEEFDREQKGTPYFAYDHAAPAKLMFDGSINTLQSGLAQSSVNSTDYLQGDKFTWRQTYVPIDTFPLPLGGLGDQTLLDMRYRWTLGGLSGIDYPQPFTPSTRP